MRLPSAARAARSIAASHDVEQLVGPPGIRREHPHDAAVVADDGGRQRVGDEARPPRGRRRRRTGRRPRPAAAVPVASVHWSKRFGPFSTDSPYARSTAGVSNAGSRVTPSSARRPPKPSSFARRRTLFEVPDHQRTEIRQRAARVDEGDDQDPAGEVAQRQRRCRPDRPAESRARPLPASPGRGRAPHRASAPRRRGDLHVLEPAAVSLTTSVATIRSPSRTAGAAAAISNAMLIAGMRPSTASWATTTRSAGGSWPTTTPVS